MDVIRRILSITIAIIATALKQTDKLKLKLLIKPASSHRGERLRAHQTRCLLLLCVSRRASRLATYDEGPIALDAVP